MFRLIEEYDTNSSESELNLHMYIYIYIYIYTIVWSLFSAWGDEYHFSASEVARTIRGYDPQNMKDAQEIIEPLGGCTDNIM